MAELQFDRKILAAVSELSNSYYLLNYSLKNLESLIVNSVKSAEKLNAHQIETLALSCIDSAYSIKMMLGSPPFEFAVIEGLSEMLEPLDRARGVRRHVHQHLTNRVDSRFGLMFGLNVIMPKLPETEDRDGTWFLFRGALSKSKSDFKRGFIWDAKWHHRTQIVFFEAKNHFVNLSVIHGTLSDIVNWLIEELLAHSKESKADYFNQQLKELQEYYREGKLFQLFYRLSKSRTITGA